MSWHDCGGSWGWRYRYVWSARFNWRRLRNFRLRWQNDKRGTRPKPGFRGFTLWRRGWDWEGRVVWKPIAMWGWEYAPRSSSNAGDVAQVLWERTLG